MTRTGLLQEFRQLTLSQQIDLLQMELKIVFANVQMAIDVERNEQSQMSLSEAAKLLRADYERDNELTTFTTLDGDSFSL